MNLWNKIKNEWKRQKERPTRWDDSYVFRKESFVYIPIILKYPIIFSGFIPYFLSAIILDNYHIEIPKPIWFYTIVFFSPMIVWIYFSVWKILPIILKKYNIIIYNVKQQNNSEVSQ